MSPIPTMRINPLCNHVKKITSCSCILTASCVQFVFVMLSGMYTILCVVHCACCRADPDRWKQLNMTIMLVPLQLRKLVSTCGNSTACCLLNQEACCSPLLYLASLLHPPPPTHPWRKLVQHAQNTKLT